MPDFWSHILCGKEVKHNLIESSYKEILEEERKVFNIGALGGDFFMFHNFWPWMKNKKVRKISTLLHTSHTGDFFIYAAEYLKGYCGSEEDFKKLFAYISGFACHYALDRTIHPYVYYHSGKYDDKKPETNKFRFYHKRLESIIDTVLLYEKEGIKSYNYPAHKFIYLGNKLPEAVTCFYVDVLKELYGINIQRNAVDDAYLDMVKVLKLLYDPMGVKVVLLKSIETLIGCRDMFSSAIYQNKVSFKKDYLNRGHRVWNHPCCGVEKYNSSIDDLFDLSVAQGTEMVCAITDYMLDNIDIHELKAYFPDVSYLTGKPVWQKCEYKYVNPIFH